MTEDLLDVGNAIVTEAITPMKTGKVRLTGLLWDASCSSNLGLQVGESVKVVGREGLKLIVEPLAYNLAYNYILIP